MSVLLVLGIMQSGTVAPRALPQATGLPAVPHLVEAGAFAAIACEAPEGGLTGLDRNALLPWLLARQKMMDQLLPLGCVLPVSLGSLVEDEVRLRLALRRSAPAIQGAFTTIRGRREMNLSVRWPLETIIADISAALPHDLRQRAGAREAGALDEVAQRLGSEIAVRRNNVRAHVMQQLAHLTDDVIETPPADPTSVLAAAFLIDPGQEPRLDTTLEDMDSAFGGQLTLRLVGPLPPYSFASVHLRLPTRQEVAAAQDLLGVAAEEEMEGIKAAYRRAARSAHQDLDASRREDGALSLAGPDLTAALTQAYRTLQAEHDPIAIRRQEQERQDLRQHA